MQCLDEYLWAIQLIRDAVKKGKLSNRPTPRQVLEICTICDIPLPASFQESVITCIPRTSRPRTRSPVSDEVIIPKRRPGRPSRLQSLATDSSDQTGYATPEDLNRRHRGERIQGREPEIQAKAKDIAIHFVRTHGRMPKFKEIVGDVAKAVGRTEPDTGRRFAINSLITEHEINQAKRFYRQQWHANLEKIETNNKY
jgi:hypothetical protein